jgi:hypothetical protein
LGEKIGYGEPSCITRMGQRPKLVLRTIASQCEGALMNATILLRILPDLRAKYALLVDGERLGDMDTLKEVIAARDALKPHDFTLAEAREFLDYRSVESPSRSRTDSAV